VENGPGCLEVWAGTENKRDKLDLVTDKLKKKRLARSVKLRFRYFVVVVW